MNMELVQLMHLRGGILIDALTFSEHPEYLTGRSDPMPYKDREIRNGKNFYQKVKKKNERKSKKSAIKFKTLSMGEIKIIFH